MKKVSPKVIKYLINKNDNICVNIQGNCMEPFFYAEDLVTVNRFNKNPKAGDIVLLFTDGDIKIHRLLYIKKNKVYTKGDNAWSLDSNIDIDNILGLYQGSERLKFRYLYTKLSFLEGIIYSITEDQHGLLLTIVSNIKEYFKMLYYNQLQK